MIKCENSVIPIFSDSVECWKGLHLLYGFLSIFFTLIFFILLFILLLFLFNPFNDKQGSVKLDTTADLFMFFFKIINVLRFIFIENDWFSIILLFSFSFLNLKKSLENPTYNNYFLECVICMRNSSILWTYLVLLVSKIFESTNFNGQIFLWIFCYPLIIGFTLIFYRNKTQNFLISNSNFNDEKQLLMKINYLRSLIESFLSKNKNSKSNNSSNMNRDEILLKGYVIIQEETCVSEDCPLKKYLNSGEDFNIQKMSLLHYMNIIYNEGMKKFPNSKCFIMDFVKFNFEKNYNLNSAKAHLAKVEKMQNNFIDEFIIYCIKQTVTTSNKINKNNTNEEEMIRIEDTAEHKFKRCKFFQIS